MAQITTTNQMIQEFSMILSNRPRFTKFNWPAHCEGKGAAMQGEMRDSNPYDSKYQSKDYQRWNEGFDYVTETLARVGK
jgi:hypothetical protein